MYPCVASKWYSGSPRSFATASNSSMDADEGQGEDELV